MAILGVGKNKADRRRLNAILEICKIRKEEIRRNKENK